MRKSTIAAIAIAILSISSGNARAQFGYPGGYGGYGWGGWGSTIGGSNAAGLGYFNMGRGAFNEQTAVARSINNDTYIRWNQYMYLSQQHANSLYHRRLHCRAHARRQGPRGHPGPAAKPPRGARHHRWRCLERAGRRPLEPLRRSVPLHDQDSAQGRADPADPVPGRFRRRDHLHRPDDDERSVAAGPEGRRLQARARGPAQGRPRCPRRRQEGRSPAQRPWKTCRPPSTAFATSSTSWFR